MTKKLHTIAALLCAGPTDRSEARAEYDTLTAAEQMAVDNAQYDMQCARADEAAADAWGF